MMGAYGRENSVEYSRAELLQGAAAVAHTLQLRVRGDAHDAHLGPFIRGGGSTLFLKHKTQAWFCFGFCSFRMEHVLADEARPPLVFNCI